ncbi:IS21 family transposase, partial [Limnohabitans sp. TS-CS-82]
MRKYLTSGVVEPKYPARSVANKLDAFAPKLEGWLKSEVKKGRKQRRNTR